MNYVVFEAGSRCGYSAEMFFADYIEQTERSNSDQLYLADIDELYLKVQPIMKNVHKISQGLAILATRDESNVVVFPGDELTRQRSEDVRYRASQNSFSYVKEWYYDKMYVNNRLRLAKSTSVLIPQTFDVEDVFLRPNKMSAGSKNVQHFKGYCATEHLDICNEYVVDILEKDGEYDIYAREVVLRNGYDKLIMLLPEESEVVIKVREFLEEVKDVQGGLFTGVFHLQIAKTADGQYYYIESSKRISGSSIVNLFRGFNPYFHIAGVENPKPYENPFEENKWYRWEDFVYSLNKILDK